MTALLTVRGLVKEYPARSRSRDKAPLRAVNGIDLDVERGQTLAIVGESGSGKSTTGRAILRLIEATAGTIMFDGIDIRRLPTRELRALRSRMQIVFQDNGAALAPRWSVGRLLAEPLRRHEQLTRREQSRRIADMLDRVGLDPRHTTRHPHEFSGGQRQRIGICIICRGVSANVLVSSERSWCTPSWWSVTNRFQHWMSRCRRRFLTS